MSELAQQAQPFRFGQTNGIPKSQLKAVHLIHENFARSLSSSLSAYLRSYVVANLVGMEHAVFSEFLAGMKPPTCLAYASVKPYDSAAILDLNLELMFAFFELLLGGKADSAVAPNREISEIEKSVVQTLLRLLLADLGESWKHVAELSFQLQSLSSEPQLMHAIAPAESVLVTSIEIKCEGKSGLMKLAIPSLLIKRLRAKFDLLQQAPKAESKEGDKQHIARLLSAATVTFQAKLDGGEISTRDLLELKPGDVLMLDHRQDKPVTGSLNGWDLWNGHIGLVGPKLAFQVDVPIQSSTL